MPTLRAAGARVARDHRRQRDERRRRRPASTSAPAAAPRSTSSPRSTISWHGAAGERSFGRESAIDFSCLQAAQLVGEALPAAASRARRASFARDVVEPLDAEGEAHAPLGAELVDQQRMLAALRTLEEERGAARLDGAVDDLRDLEVRVDLGVRRGRARPRARAARSSRAGRPEAPWRSRSRAQPRVLRSRAVTEPCDSSPSAITARKTARRSASRE